MGLLQFVLAVPSHVPPEHPEATLSTPVVVLPNHVALILVAGEIEPPHVPVIWLIPPRVSETVSEVVVFANRATAVPFIDKLFVIVVMPTKVLSPEPESIRLE